MISVSYLKPGNKKPENKLEGNKSFNKIAKQATFPILPKGEVNKKIDSKSGLGLGTFIGKTLLERMKADVKFGKCPNNNGAMMSIEWETKNLFSI